MKEIQDIINKAAKFSTGEKAILATVVDVVGSGYRRPGARMLIDENGYSIGTVSGGCLEADVLERAKKVLETGEPTVITYDTTQDENSVFGLSMGCRGIVRILLEPFEKENILLKTLANCFRNACNGNLSERLFRRIKISLSAVECFTVMFDQFRFSKSAECGRKFRTIKK